jgi:hypothetical protein
MPRRAAEEDRGEAAVAFLREMDAVDGEGTPARAASA